MKHGHSWEGAAPESDAAWCRVRHPMQLPVRRCRVWAFFFFFHGFTSTRLDSSRLSFYSRQFVLNRDDSARIKLYRPNQVISAGNRNGSKQPKSALNHAETAKIRPKHPKSVLSQFYSEYLLLLLCFLFCFAFCLCCLPSSFFVLWSRHSNVFFKNILIVKIYRKYK